MRRRLQQAQQRHQLSLMRQALEVQSIPLYHLLPTCISTLADGTLALRYDASDSSDGFEKCHSSHFLPISQSPFVISTPPFHPLHDNDATPPQPITTNGHKIPFSTLPTRSSSTLNSEYRSTTDYRSSPFNRGEKTRTLTYTSPTKPTKSVERTIPIIRTEPTPIVPQSIISLLSTRTSSVPFHQSEIPVICHTPTEDIPIVFEQQSSLLHNDSRTSPVVRSNTNQERIRTPPLLTPTQSIEKQNIYQEIDSASTDAEPLQTPNADLQFICGAIQRVFDFHSGSTTTSTSDSSIHYEEVSDENLNKSKTRYPAVAAVQRFYNHKPLSDFEKRIPIEPITNLDAVVISSSSTSKKTRTHSPPITARQRDRSKLSEPERASSEQIDGTLNGIADCKHRNHSSHTSSVNSPLHLSDCQSQIKKTSQETQTIGLQNTTRTMLPPFDTVTELVIERDHVDDTNGIIDAVSTAMVIFSDDIEILEHSTSSYSSESWHSSNSFPSRQSPPILRSPHHFHPQHERDYLLAKSSSSPLAGGPVDSTLLNVSVQCTEFQFTWPDGQTSWFSEPLPPRSSPISLDVAIFVAPKIRSSFTAELGTKITSPSAACMISSPRNSYPASSLLFFPRHRQSLEFLLVSILLAWLSLIWVTLKSAQFNFPLDGRDVAPDLHPARRLWHVMVP